MFISVNEQNNKTPFKSKSNEIFNELIIGLSSIFKLNIEFFKKIPLKSVSKSEFILFFVIFALMIKQVFSVVILDIVRLKVNNKIFISLYDLIVTLSFIVSSNLKFRFKSSTFFIFSNSIIYNKNLELLIVFNCK